MDLLTPYLPRVVLVTPVETSPFTIVGVADTKLTKVKIKSNKGTESILKQKKEHKENSEVIDDEHVDVWA